MVVSGATILVIIVLISFTVTVMCTRKSLKPKDKQQAITSIEVVYDEIRCYEKVTGQENSADRVVCKENAAYGELM